MKSATKRKVGEVHARTTLQRDIARRSHVYGQTRNALHYTWARVQLPRASATTFPSAQRGGAKTGSEASNALFDGK